MEDDQITLTDVRRVRLEPGDVLVVRLDKPATAAIAERITALCKDIFPNNRAIILDRDADLEVVANDG